MFSNQYKRILVTGATGFIGEHLFNHLRKNWQPGQTIAGIGRGFQSRYTDPRISRDQTELELHCDLTNTQEAAETVAWFQPDLIYHCAAKATTKVEHPLDERQMIEQNIIATHNLLYAAHEVDVVFTSTILVHDGKDMSDSPYWYEGEPKPKTMYGTTKAAAENIIKSSKNVRNAHIVRMCAVVGAGTKHGMLKDFVTKARSEDKEFVIYGPNKSDGCVKPYIHVDDVTNYLTRWGTSTTLTANSIRATEVAIAVMEVVGVKKPIKMSGDDFWRGDTPYINSRLSTCITYSSVGAIKKAVREILSV